ncbi:MAG: hypothetical protein ACYC4D_08230 [Thermoleophilia bacterium]
MLKYALMIILLAFLFPDLAAAYVGPGAGMSAIGVFLAVVAGVIVAAFGFVWYPVKRLMRKIKKPKKDI